MTDSKAASDAAVVVNGAPRAVRAGLSVAGLLEELDVHAGMVVVEHNRVVLARDRLPTTRLRDGDRVEIVHFVGGG